MLHEVFFATQTQHGQQTHLGAVVAIFGAAFTLGNPNRSIFFADEVEDVGGELHGITIEFAGSARSFHHKTFVDAE